MKVVQFVALDSPEDRLGHVLESMLWTKNHLKKPYGLTVERFKYYDGYWNALMKYWDQGEDLVVIEQDMLPLDRHLESFELCPADFCTVPYDLGDGRLSIYEILKYELNAEGPTGPVGFDVPTIQNHTRRVSNTTGSGIGLARFTSKAQTLIDLTKYPVPKHHWSLIDLWISAKMDLMGQRWHVHYPEVGHLHFRY